ncbi:Serine esterase [Labilithrix luteola]|uniref:Serine esterase n=1 Tax=Labilithrix luteola TaxID=1391654 RepID=A0A0K1PUY9_9BACT|nr:dienelactone hydrolase family protein [Labilithrix luteola]AKU97337.1 Serine esterase [Labilithrix luteola]
MSAAMLSRRDVFLRGALVAFSFGFVACSRQQPEPQKTQATPPSWPRRSTHEGVDFIELFPSNADESSPILVAIHGRGDRPENWIDTWREFPAPVRVVLPRAFDPFGDGYTWFPLRSTMSDEDFGKAVGDAEARLWNAVSKLTGGKRVLVTGFSQGGILSYAFAARHPTDVIHAFPVAGALPKPLLPTNGAHSAPITAFHGTADKMIPFAWGRESIDALVAGGSPAELHEYPGSRTRSPPKSAATSGRRFGKRSEPPGP